MTCANCEEKVKSSLLTIGHVTAAEVSKENQAATITMDKHIALSTIQNALDKKYVITTMDHSETAMQAKSWLSTYKPLLLIFGYITAIALLVALKQNEFGWMHGMNIFMAGFFLSFSFFKMLDLKGFAESYSMYDIIAKKARLWGFIYAFIEFALGLAYAAGFMPFLTNVVTLMIMTVSIIGVLQSVFNKRKIQCACLGAVFNLPMSTVTIIEDSLMIAMSSVMLVNLS